jgi:hypothetical protein
MGIALEANSKIERTISVSFLEFLEPTHGGNHVQQL